MSKYLARGPYHYIDFCNKSSIYHEHVMALMDEISELFWIDNPEDNIRVLEVGCGEGLILQQLHWRFGFLTFGCDIDPRAIEMSKLISKNAIVTQNGNIASDSNQWFDAILFCDSLEHIENWREHIEWAMRCSDCVIIAVPDKHDPNGLRDFKLDSFDDFFKGWKCEIRKQRASRFVTIWCRE